MAIFSPSAGSRYRSVIEINYNHTEVELTYTLILHIHNADPVVGEVDELPEPSDNLIIINNPRMRDGKDVPYLAENVVTVLWAVDKLSFIEVLAGKDEEEIIGFVRE